MSGTKNYNDKDTMFRIMENTQMNYANMLKRLQGRKAFSNFVITYYSIVLITYSLTAKFFPCHFDEKLSSYLNIILSVVVLTYSLIISNARYPERVQSAENILNEVKNIKRQMTDENVEGETNNYNDLLGKGEVRSDIDFFRTLKQKCKKYNIKWYRYKKDIPEKIDKSEDQDKKDNKKISEELADELEEHFGEVFPYLQQVKIVLHMLWDGIIIITPLVLFVVCFLVKNK